MKSTILATLSALIVSSAALPAQTPGPPQGDTEFKACVDNGAQWAFCLIWHYDGAGCYPVKQLGGGGMHAVETTDYTWCNVYPEANCGGIIQGHLDPSQRRHYDKAVLSVYCWGRD